MILFVQDACIFLYTASFMSVEKSTHSEVQKKDIQHNQREANATMAIGAGVGVAGTVAAVITGAVCPLCYIVAPGLIGLGAYKRWKIGSKKQ